SVRWKTLLRSDALHEVDDDGRQLLADYGLRTSVDLREPAEREQSPDRLHPEVRLVSIPLFSYGRSSEEGPVDPNGFSSLDEVYRYVVTECGPAVVAALQALAEAESLPAVVHCAGGKDRTGIVIALLLASLGVPDEIIAADYTATRFFLTEEARQAAIARAIAAGQDGARLAALSGCPEQLILDVLGMVRSYGSVDAYFANHGLKDTELEELRHRLLKAAE
ncbi:MAG: protein tyrosine/serine phosphatase, partial [Acidimicrobiaceae bacterium]|nr:protein tyrosine/serine phosphatase [Acidimicrobiaceae bacterium]